MPRSPHFSPSPGFAKSIQYHDQGAGDLPLALSSCVTLSELPNLSDFQR